MSDGGAWFMKPVGDRVAMGRVVLGGGMVVVVMGGMVIEVGGALGIAIWTAVFSLQSELAFVRLIIIYMTLLLSHPPMPGGLGKPAGVGRVPGDSGAVVVGRQGDSCPLPGIAHNSFVSKVGVKPHADNAVGKP